LITAAVLNAETGSNAWLRCAALGDDASRQACEEVPAVITSFFLEDH
jgi:hypothetical protein